LNIKYIPWMAGEQRRTGGGELTPTIASGDFWGLVFVVLNLILLG
jgi:hypothetical protein